jgi:adenine specific DNA methylase Mod
MYTGDPMEEQPNNYSPEKYSENNKNIGELRQDGTRAVPLEQYSKEELIQQVKNLKKQLKTKNAFGLVFERQKEDAIIRRKTQAPVLKENKEKHINNGGQDNLLLIGDNIDSLTCLLSTHKGKIDVIYIDPPYNTGNEDFIYNDKYVNPEDAFRHSKWLSFMEARLLLAKELLSETGVIFASIDDNEQAQLKMLMDSIFGENNFAGQFVWVNNSKGRQINTFGPAGTYEFILCYSKNFNLLEEFRIESSLLKEIMPKAYKGFNFEMKQDTKGEYFITNELYNSNGAFNEKTRPNLVYDIYYNPKTGEVIPEDVSQAHIHKEFIKIIPHMNANTNYKYHAYRWGREKLVNGKEDLEFIKQKDGSYRVYSKRRDTTTSVKNLITDIDGSAGRITLEKILSNKSFDYPKPVQLIKLLIGLNSNKNATVLDFFAGSGTTGHAVLELNKEDGGNRKFILCTNDEAGIGETVTYERIKRVITGENWADGKEHESHEASLRYFNVDFVDRDVSSAYGSDSAANKLDGLVCIAEDLYETVYASNMVTVYSNGVRGRFAAIVRDPWGLDELEKFFENESPNVLTVYVNDSFADYRQELSEVVPEGWDVSYVSLESFFFGGLKYADRLLKNYMAVGDSVVSDNPVDMVEYDEGLYSDGNNVSDLGEE